MAEAQEHQARRCSSKQHNFEGAIAEYRKALALDANYVNAHNNLGNALDALGRHGEAIVEYQAALRIFPPYALAHHNLVITLRRKGDSNGAAEQERLACAFDPQTYCPSQSSQQDVCAMARHACIDVGIQPNRREAELDAHVQQLHDGLVSQPWVHWRTRQYPLSAVVKHFHLIHST